MIAAIYVRTSTLRQGEEGTSLETQEEQSRLKAIELGYEVDPAYIWREMESGAYTDRPGLNFMLQAVRNREVDIVIVYDHDRLSRDPLDLLNILRACTDAGVRLEFVRGPSDTSPEGQLMTYFMGYAAQRERLQFMERSMRGKERAARDGRMPATGGVGLYGYNYDRALRQRVINETEAEVVRKMFQWASEGISKNRIACMLNERNIPTKTGKLWSQTSVKRTLQNLAYTGAQYYGRFRVRSVRGGKREVTKKPDSEAILIEGVTPQLISPEFFKAVQERLVNISGRGIRKGPRYMLSGFAKCGNCGSPLVGSMLARGIRYYRCISTRSRAERPAICNERYIREAWLEGSIWKIVTDRIRCPEILSLEVLRHVQTGDGDLGERMTKLRREIADLKRQQGNLIDLRQNDMIDLVMLENRIGPLNLRRDEKERELGVLEDQQNKKDDVLHAKERIANTAGGWRKDSTIWK